MMTPEQLKAIKDFQDMKDRAELNALNQESLIRPLTDKEYKRYKQLAKEVMGIGQ